MAIKPGYKQFTFDGENSGDYGVYITGSAVYNSPKRDVELIEIPGRNGSFVLDNGRFENIEVTYPAGIYAESQEEFAQAISDLRNMLASRKGYCRLTDEYNPEEYRMAVYKSGLDVDPVAFQRAGEFSITFDCKPQRWLTSGETEIAVTSGDELTNPTLFESSPLLKVAGPGTIEFNGYEIELSSYPYGEIVIGNKETYAFPSTVTVPIDISHVNVGDPIYPELKECRITDILDARNSTTRFTNVIVHSTTNVLEADYLTYKGGTQNYHHLNLLVYPDFGDGFVYGTAKTINCEAIFYYNVGPNFQYAEKIDIAINYGGADTYTVTVTRPSVLPSNVSRYANVFLYSPTMYADSTAPNPAPINIDCDLGEAYTNENGIFRSLNQYIDLGSKLPTLAVGTTEITFDNTITDFKIVPRWWKV